MASLETAEVACRQTPGDVAVGADQHRVGLAEAVAPLDLAIGVDEVLPDDEHLHRDVWQVHDGVVPAVTARTGEQGQPAFEQVDGRAPLAGVGDPGVWGPGSRRGLDHGAVLRRGRLGVRLDGARRVHHTEVVAQVVAALRARTPRARPGRCGGRRGIAPRRRSRAVTLRPARAPPTPASSRGCGRRRSRCSCRWRRGASCGGPRRPRGTPRRPGCRLPRRRRRTRGRSRAPPSRGRARPRPRGCRLPCAPRSTRRRSRRARGGADGRTSTGRRCRPARRRACPRGR